MASPAQQALPDNRLTQLDDARYRYDGAGNLIERQQPDGERLTMGYDGANRLVHLTHASASGETRDATYRYDGLGRRISKIVRHPDGTTATTHYGWDGDRIVREETDQQRTTVVYEPGSFVPMLRIEDTPQGQRLSAYVTDALGTPMQLVNAHGETAWQAQPHDWAATRNERGHTTQPIRFQGQWHDEESGLYYNRHRYYDPQQGRYISQDPIGLQGGTNLYGYVTNPTGMVDPLGLEGEHIFWRAIKDVPRMFGQYISDRRNASSQSMCSALGNLRDNEAILSVAGGKGLAAELGLKVSSSGISTIAGIGAGGGAALVASVGQSINHGAINEHIETAWRGFTSISAGTGVLGGDASLSTGTDGITGSMRGGYGFGAAIVSGAQVETYILDCYN
ncbi:RHS repeat-associated core domain-containing protein [Vreelandella stevensii]|uniref:RHS repeat-associated core domain-containing protein n=1 Tax=Vreelandella stevensii TaxID=502821 RepID=UPI00374981D0